MQLLSEWHHFNRKGWHGQTEIANRYGYNRLKGFSKIKRNDITVFNFPNNKNTFYIKRCIGLPGELLKINNGVVFCNNREISLSSRAKLKYRIWPNNIHQFLALTDSLQFKTHGNFDNRGKKYKELDLSLKQFKAIKNSPFIDSLAVIAAKPDTIPHTYPYKRFLWTSENFGPVIIPKKGLQIDLTMDNYFLYKKAINTYERQNFTLKNNLVLNNGKPITKYTFKQDYFFMMGDNRHNSYDSRGLGFVPNEALVGKVVLLLFSNDYSGFKWNRLFKTIK